MNELLVSIGFFAAVMGFALGVASIVFAITHKVEKENQLKHRIEYGFFGVAGLLIALVLGTATLS